MKKRLYLMLAILFLALSILVYSKEIGRTTSIFIISLGLIIICFCLIMQFMEAINKIIGKSKTLEKIEKADMKKFVDEFEKKRQMDILMVLGFNEKIVVNYLLTHNNYSFFELIKKSTDMPKGVLKKTLTTLRSKNIVSVTKKDKVMKVSLTRWFLDKR